MSRPIRQVAVILLLVQLTACASLHALRPDVTKQIDEWIAENEYAKAIGTIEAIGPRREQYQQLQARLPEIRRRAERYETQLVRESLRLAADRRWQEALDVIDLGLERVPDADRLRTTREQVVSERDDYLATLDTRLLISKAEQLVRDLPVRNEIVGIIPRDRDARQARERAQSEAATVAEALLSRGKQARLQREDYLALRCLRLSIKLSPSDEARAALAELEGSRRRNEGAARAAHRHRLAKEKATQRDALITAYKSAFANGDLANARRELDAAATLAPADREILSLESELRLAIDEQVQEGIELGRRRYIVGDIQGALETWTPLLELDPDNKKLQEHIDRARRVLRNLKELEEREPTIKLPG